MLLTCFLLVHVGIRLAVSVNSSVHIWDASDSSAVGVGASDASDDSDTPVLAACVAAHGGVVATVDRAGVLELRTCGGDSSARSELSAVPSVLAFSKDAGLIACGCENGRVFVVRVGDTLCSVVADHNISLPITALAFGDTDVVCGTQRGVLLCVATANLASGDACKYVGHVRQVDALDVSQHFVASGDRDGLLKIWHRRSQLCLYTVRMSPEQIRPVFSCQLASDERAVVFTSLDGRVCVWQYATRFPCALSGHLSTVLCLSVSLDEAFLLAGCADGVVWVFSVATGTTVDVYVSHVSAVRHVTANSTFSLVLSSGDDCKLCLVDQRGHLIRGHLRGHTGSVTSCAFVDSIGTVVSGSLDRTIVVWNVVSLSRVHSFMFSAPVCCVAVGGRFVFGGASDGTMGVWDIGGSSEQPLHMCSDASEGGITCCDMNSSGTAVVCGHLTGKVRFWDMSTHNSVVLSVAATLPACVTAVRLITYAESSEVYIIAVSVSLRAYIVSVKDLGIVAEFDEGTLRVASASCVSRAGRIASATGPHIAFWSQDKLCLSMERAHSREGLASLVCAMSVCGRYVATAGSDGFVKLWTRTGDRVAVWRTPAAVCGLTFRTDNTVHVLLSFLVRDSRRCDTLRARNCTAAVIVSAEDTYGAVGTLAGGDDGGVAKYEDCEAGGTVSAYASVRRLMRGDKASIGAWAEEYYRHGMTQLSTLLMSSTPSSALNAARILSSQLPTMLPEKCREFVLPHGQPAAEAVVRLISIGYATRDVIACIRALAVTSRRVMNLLVDANAVASVVQLVREDSDIAAAAIEVLWLFCVGASADVPALSELPHASVSSCKFALSATLLGLRHEKALRFMIQASLCDVLIPLLRVARGDDTKVAICGLVTALSLCEGTACARVVESGFLQLLGAFAFNGSGTADCIQDIAVSFYSCAVCMSAEVRLEIVFVEGLVSGLAKYCDSCDERPEACVLRVNSTLQLLYESTQSAVQQYCSTRLATDSALTSARCLRDLLSVAPDGLTSDAIASLILACADPDMNVSIAALMLLAAGLRGSVSGSDPQGHIWTAALNCSRSDDSRVSGAALHLISVLLSRALAHGGLRRAMNEEDVSTLDIAASSRMVALVAGSHQDALSFSSRGDCLFVAAHVLLFARSPLSTLLCAEFGAVVRESDAALCGSYDRNACCALLVLSLLVNLLPTATLPDFKFARIVDAANLAEPICRQLALAAMAQCAWHDHCRTLVANDGRVLSTSESALREALAVGRSGFTTQLENGACAAVLGVSMHHSATFPAEFARLLFQACHGAGHESGDHMVALSTLCGLAARFPGHPELQLICDVKALPGGGLWRVLDFIRRADSYRDALEELCERDFAVPRYDNILHFVVEDGTSTCADLAIFAASEIVNSARPKQLLESVIADCARLLSGVGVRAFFRDWCPRRHGAVSPIKITSMTSEGAGGGSGGELELTSLADETDSSWHWTGARYASSSLFVNVGNMSDVCGVSVRWRSVCTCPAVVKVYACVGSPPDDVATCVFEGPVRGTTDFEHFAFAVVRTAYIRITFVGIGSDNTGGWLEVRNVRILGAVSAASIVPGPLETSGLLHSVLSCCTARGALRDSALRCRLILSSATAVVAELLPVCLECIMIGEERCNSEFAAVATALFDAIAEADTEYGDKKSAAGRRVKPQSVLVPYSDASFDISGVESTYTLSANGRTATSTSDVRAVLRVGAPISSGRAMWVFTIDGDARGVCLGAVNRDTAPVVDFEASPSSWMYSASDGVLHGLGKREALDGGRCPPIPGSCFVRIVADVDMGTLSYFVDDADIGICFHTSGTLWPAIATFRSDRVVSLHYMGSSGIGVPRSLGASAASRDAGDGGVGESKEGLEAAASFVDTVIGDSWIMPPQRASAPTLATFCDFGFEILRRLGNLASSATVTRASAIMEGGCCVDVDEPFVIHLADSTFVELAAALSFLRTDDRCLPGVPHALYAVVLLARANLIRLHSCGIRYRQLGVATGPSSPLAQLGVLLGALVHDGVSHEKPRVAAAAAEAFFALLTIQCIAKREATDLPSVSIGGVRRSGRRLSDARGWCCASCSFVNSAASITCEMCTLAKIVGSAWNCTSCTFSNTATALSCAICSAARVAELAGVASGDSWTCELCTTMNATGSVVCNSCVARRPQAAASSSSAASLSLRDPPPVSDAALAARVLRFWIASPCSDLRALLPLCRESRGRGEGNPSRLRRVLSEGTTPVDIDAAEARKLLLVCAKAGDLTGVRRALDVGATVDSRDAASCTALYFACLEGHENIVRELVGRGATSIANDGDVVPLAVAALGGHVGCLRIVASAMPDQVNHVNAAGNTALHAAVAGGMLDAVLALLEAGARSVADGDGVTPADMADAKLRADMSELLRAHETSQSHLVASTVVASAVDSWRLVAHPEFASALRRVGLGSWELQLREAVRLTGSERVSLDHIGSLSLSPSDMRSMVDALGLASAASPEEIVSALASSSPDERNAAAASLAHLDAVGVARAARVGVMSRIVENLRRDEVGPESTAALLRAAIALCAGQQGEGGPYASNREKFGAAGGCVILGDLLRRYSVSGGDATVTDTTLLAIRVVADGCPALRRALFDSCHGTVLALLGTVEERELLKSVVTTVQSVSDGYADGVRVLLDDGLLAAVLNHLSPLTVCDDANTALVSAFLRLLANVFHIVAVSSGFQDVTSRAIEGIDGIVCMNPTLREDAQLQEVVGWLGACSFACAGVIELVPILIKGIRSVDVRAAAACLCGAGQIYRGRAHVAVITALNEGRAPEGIVACVRLMLGGAREDSDAGVATSVGFAVTALGAAAAAGEVSVKAVLAADAVSALCECSVRCRDSVPLLCVQALGSIFAAAPISEDSVYPVVQAMCDALERPQGDTVVASAHVLALCVSCCRRRDVHEAARYPGPVRQIGVKRVCNLLRGKIGRDSMNALETMILVDSRSARLSDVLAVPKLLCAMLAVPDTSAADVSAGILLLGRVCAEGGKPITEAVAETRVGSLLSRCLVGAHELLQAAAQIMSCGSSVRRDFFASGGGATLSAMCRCGPIPTAAAVSALPVMICGMNEECDGRRVLRRDRLPATCAEVFIGILRSQMAASTRKETTLEYSIVSCQDVSGYTGCQDVQERVELGRRRDDSLSIVPPVPLAATLSLRTAAAAVVSTCRRVRVLCVPCVRVMFLFCAGVTAALALKWRLWGCSMNCAEHLHCCLEIQMTSVFVLEF